RVPESRHSRVEPLLPVLFELRSQPRIFGLPTARLERLQVGRELLFVHGEIHEGATGVVQCDPGKVDLVAELEAVGVSLGIAPGHLLLVELLQAADDLGGRKGLKLFRVQWWHAEEWYPRQPEPSLGSDPVRNRFTAVSQHDLDRCWRTSCEW